MREKIKQVSTRLIMFELIWTNLYRLSGHVGTIFDINILEKWSQKQVNYFKSLKGAVEGFFI